MKRPSCIIMTLALLMPSLCQACGGPNVGWIKSLDGNLDVFVDGISNRVTIAKIWHDPLRSVAGRALVNGKPIPMNPSRTNVLWTASVTNTFLNFSTVYVVNNGTRVIVVCRLADAERDRPDLRAVVVYNRDGSVLTCDWRRFISTIVEIEPQTSLQERYHWLRSVDKVTGTELRLTNARGSQLSLDLTTGKVTWIKRSTDEPRDPFGETKGSQHQPAR